MNRLLLILTLLLTCSLAATVPVYADSTSAKDNKADQAKPPVEKNYWLTIKSGVRHNSKCRYYHNSNGRPCTKDEGRACKLCGG